MTDKSAKAKSQCNRLLRHMRRYRKGITSMDAFTMYGITRLSSRIFDLRGMGYDIETIREVKKNEDGHTVNYARYVLHEN